MKKREFGDHMAAEGKTSHVSTIITIMYAVIIGYSVLAGYLTSTAWYTQIMFYFVILFEFYAWHLLAHQKWMGPMYRVHLQHHMHAFPPSNFYGPKDAFKKMYGTNNPTFLQLFDITKITFFSFVHEGILYILLTLTLVVEKYLLNYPWSATGFTLFLALSMGYIGSALHTSFHVKGIELEKYEWYLELRAYHYVHHLGTTQQNFGVLNIGVVDGLFQTLLSRDPLIKLHKDGEAITLPEKISHDNIKNVQKSIGSILLDSLFHPPISDACQEEMDKRKGVPTVLTRIILVLACFWFWGQGTKFLLQMSRPVITKVNVIDMGQSFVSSLREYLSSKDLLTEAHDTQIIISDALCIVLSIMSVLGKSVRPAFTVLFSIVMRALLRAITPIVFISTTIILPPIHLSSFLANGMHGEEEHVIRAAYLCPHLIPAVVFALEICTSKDSGNNLYLQTLSLTMIIYQAVVSLALHSTWSMDLIVVTTIALFAFNWAGKFSPRVDYMRSL